MKTVITAIITFFSLLCLMISAQGCSSDSCLQNQSAIPLAQFCNSATGDKLSLDSIEIGGLGAPQDSLLKKVSSAGITQIYLPMRPTATDVTWRITYKKKEAVALGLYDDITISYTSEPYFASEECGAFYCYNITDITHTSVLIDSIKVVDPLITNFDKIYLKIYFATDEKGGEE